MPKKNGKNKEFNKNMIHSFFEPVLEYPFRVSYEIIINSLIIISSLTIIELVRRIITNIENGVPFNENYIYIYIMALVIIVPPIIRMLTYYSEPKLFVLTNQYLYKKYFGRFIYLDNQETSKYGTGQLISIIKGGIDDWTDQLWQLYYHGIPQIITYIFTLGMLAYIDVRLLIPAGFFTLVVGLFIYIVNARTHKFRVLVRKLHEGLMRQVAKIIMEKFNILKNNKIDKEQELIDENREKVLKVGHNKGFYLSALKVGTEGIMSFVTLAFMLWVGWYGIDSGMSVTDIAVIVMLSGLLSKYALRATDYYRQLTSKSSNIARTIEFFRDTPTIKGFDKGEKLVFKKGDISIKDISYSYPNQDKKVFENFSLDIDGSKKTAFVGGSGVGKSTLIKLVLRFIAPSSGNIFLDGQKLSNVSLQSYYKVIGYLSQEPSVFDGTVYENLTYGLPDNVNISDDILNKVLKKAECDFVFEFKEGMETEIGEKGIKLSGGERQRLAIARLLLQAPKIIILDEPTSALDSISEEKVTKAIHELCKDKTVIIIAHRLQTVKDTDKIVVLGKNSILESGKHEELLEKNGVYSKMVDLQSGKIG